MLLFCNKATVKASPACCSPLDDKVTAQAGSVRAVTMLALTQHFKQQCTPSGSSLSCRICLSKQASAAGRSSNAICKAPSCMRLPAHVGPVTHSLLVNLRCFNTPNSQVVSLTPSRSGPCDCLTPGAACTLQAQAVQVLTVRSHCLRLWDTALPDMSVIASTVHAGNWPGTCQQVGSVENAR